MIIKVKTLVFCENFMSTVSRNGIFEKFTSIRVLFGPYVRLVYFSKYLILLK